MAERASLEQLASSVFSSGSASAIAAALRDQTLSDM